MLVGASEIALEKVLGGISALGGNALGKTAIKNLDNASTALKRVARVAGSAVSEFGEEYLQEILTPLFRNIALGTGEEVKVFSEEALYSGFLGALTGGIVETADTRASAMGNMAAVNTQQETGRLPRLSAPRNNSRNVEQAHDITVVNQTQVERVAAQNAVNAQTKAISQPIDSYPTEKQNMIHSYIRSVDESIKNFVHRVKNGDKTFRRQKISDVSERASKDIGKILGIDVSDYTHNINTSGVQHIIKRHGENGAQDQSMALDDDIARIGWVLENYDFVQPLSENGNQIYSSEFKDHNGGYAPQIRFVKKIDGTYYVVEATCENKYKKLWVQSAYLQKNGDVTQVSAEGQTTNHETNARSALASPSPADSVPQNTAKVNGHFNEKRAQGMDTREPSAAGEQTGLADIRGIEKDMDGNVRQAILVHKKLKVVEDVHSASYAEDIRSIEALPAKAKSKMEKIIKPLAEKLGILNRGLKTPDVEIEFQFSRNKGLKESLSKQLRYGGSYADFARALTNLDSILKNAVLIEKHGDKYAGTVREDKYLEDVSVLLGMFRDRDGMIPVQMEIKKTTDSGSHLYMVVSMAKIETGVLGSTMDKSPSRSLIPASEYSLPEVFSKINPADRHFLKYVPDGFLSEEQKEAKQSALREDAARIAQYGRIGTGGTYTSDVNGDDLYQQMVEEYIAQEGSEDYEQWLRELLAREG